MKNFCLMNNLSFFLQSHGISINETELSIITGCYGFMYLSHETEFERLKGVNASFFELFTRMQTNICCQFKKHQFYQADEYIKSLIYYLSQTGAIVVWINDYFKKDSVHYLKNNVCRPVVVMAANSKEIQFYDMGIKVSNIKQFVNMTDENGLSVFTAYTAKEKIMQCDKNLLIKNGLNQMYDYFNKSGKQMLAEFRRELEHLNDTRRFYEYYYSLKMPGGLVNSRLIFANISDIMNIEALIKNNIKIICDYGEKLSYQWKITANLLFRLSEHYESDLHQRILHRLDEIIIMEKQFWPLFTKESQFLNYSHQEAYV
ncbi:MAG: hypothetical protein PHV32_00460 [Eubacteriales bacterium]|nr:hypothetical protein [Eubacteriales bacterium]